MTLYDKLNKQKELKEKLADKKNNIVKQIEQAEEQIKIIQEDIENLEMNNTLKVIKSKGYSILDVVAIRESKSYNKLEGIQYIFLFNI